MTKEQKQHCIKNIWDRVQVIEHDINIGQSRRWMRLHLAELETYIETLTNTKNPFPVTIK